MDTAEYREIVESLQDHLRQVGAGEVADIRHYSSRDPETDESRLLPPRELAIAMLLAFERYLSVRDRHTLYAGLERINGTLKESSSESKVGPGQVEDAAFVPISGAIADTSISLHAAPDLHALRRDVRRLVAQMRADGDPPQETDES